MSRLLSFVVAVGLSLTLSACSVGALLGLGALGLVAPVVDGYNSEMAENLDPANLRDRQRMVDLLEVKTGLELYFDAYLEYPSVEAYGELYDPLFGEYPDVEALPTDPLTGEGYFYLASPDQASYVLATRFESGELFTLSSSYENPSSAMLEAAEALPPLAAATAESPLSAEEVNASMLDLRRRADLNELRTALELYYFDYLNYPLVDDFAGLEEELVPLYLETLPTDPEPTSSYRYRADAEGTAFVLEATLSDESTLTRRSVGGDASGL